MWRRRLLFLGCVSGLLLVAFSFKSFLPKDPISMEGYQQIQVGMTQREVESVLEGAPGNYASRPVSYQWDCAVPAKRPHKVGNIEHMTNVQWWEGNEARILVGFSREGK